MPYGCSEELPKPQWLVRRTKLWFHRSGLDRTWALTIHYQDRVTVEGRRCKAATIHLDHRADLYIAKWFYEEAEGDDVDFLICHELSHLFIASMDDTLQHHIGDSGAVWRAYEKEAEVACDAFAKTLTRAYMRKKDRA